MLRRLRYAQMSSAAVRSVLGLYYRPGRVYRIPLGPLRGCQLYYDRSVHFHPILGLWETESLQFLSRLLSKGGFLRDGMVVADIGANIGLFSLWFFRLLANRKGTIIAFEPNPEVLQILKKNLSINDAEKVMVFDIACSDKEGTTEFFVGNDHHISSLIESWAKDGKVIPKKVMVNTSTIDNFFCRSTPTLEMPDFIKMDIEGGGVFALKGCDKCVREKRPLIWMESHTPDEDKAISDLIVKFDYFAYRINDHQIVKNRTLTHPHPQGVWGTMLLYPWELSNRLLPFLKVM